MKWIFAGWQFRIVACFCIHTMEYLLKTYISFMVDYTIAFSSWLFMKIWQWKPIIISHRVEAFWCTIVTKIIWKWSLKLKGANSKVYYWLFMKNMKVKPHCNFPKSRGFLVFCYLPKLYQNEDWNAKVQIQMLRPTITIVETDNT